MRIENVKSLRQLDSRGFPAISDPARFTVAELGLDFYYMTSIAPTQQTQLYGARAFLEQLTLVSHRLREEFLFSGIIHQGIVNRRRTRGRRRLSQHSWGIAIDVAGFTREHGDILWVVNQDFRLQLLEIQELFLGYFHKVSWWDGRPHFTVNEIRRDHFHVVL